MKYLVLIISLLCSIVATGQQLNSYLVDKNEIVNLIVFIGQRVSIDSFDPNADRYKQRRIEIDSISGDSMIINPPYVMDNAFIAKYRVLSYVYNDLKIDTITFTVYDHYRRPSFEDYPTVLLYISKNKEKNYYYHQKYQFDVLHLSHEGAWVGPNSETVKQLFEEKKNNVFTERAIFHK